MLRTNARNWRTGILVGLCLALALSTNAGAAPRQGGSAAAPPSLIVTDALPGAIAGQTSSAEYQIVGAAAPTAGPLTYTDLRLVEGHARDLLTRNREFRHDISPHNEKLNFEELVQDFDYDVGFDRIYAGTQTLQDRIDIADAELRHVRDLYAYLAVYADAARFRADPEVDCGAGADDPFADPPLIDQCNFAARMRESLREAAYVRMIFGQQFTADALGFRFGANIIGGEEFVKDEVEQLEMAAEQFALAREAVMEGLGHYLGNGCYVHSFYTEAEWALLSRAVEGLERAQHHTAVRKSYLAPDETGLPAARAEANQIFRAAAIGQYVDLVLAANLATGQFECERGTRPDNDLVAEMVANMISTRQSARDIQEGRNIFGFDVRFTPDHPYLSTGDVTGLLDSARSSAEEAQEIQDIEANLNRDFDRSREQLESEILHVKDEYDLRLGDLTGCSTSLPDEPFFACVDAAAGALRACDPWQEEGFEACVQGSGAGGLLREAWEDLRTAALEVRAAEQALVNMMERKTIEEERNSKVRHEILTNGEAQAAMEFAATLLDSLSVQCGLAEAGCSVSYNPAQPAIAALRMGQTLRQATADANIEDANSEAVVRNLLLDIVELQIDLEIAAHKANALVTVFENLASGTADLAIEARRARAYVASSPANDPSYRLVRDSLRLKLADHLELAARLGYMAAKRAEYEYALRLGVNRINMSDIYQARTAEDIEIFLDELEAVTTLQNPSIDREEFTVSVAQHVLGWTDEELGLSGEAARNERTRRFREWAAAHIKTVGGKPTLVFSFPTSAADNGVFANVIGQFYDRFWLHKVAGVGEPMPVSNGLGLNVVTAQTGVPANPRAVVTQSGLVHLKAQSGCIFEYRLIHPAPMLGLEWPDSQNPEIATATVLAAINGQGGTRTTHFMGRPVSSTAWQIELGLGDIDVQQMEDIELIFDTTSASRQPGVPEPSECIRIDF
jgi:hypothetical protein